MVDIVVGAGFGDEGKGCVISNLVYRHQITRTPLIIRYAGGPQNGHSTHFYNDKDIHIIHSQIGSFANPNNPVITHILPSVPVNLHALIVEYDEYRQYNHDFPSLSKIVKIHHECPLITPDHVFINKIRERILKHGSQGCGVLECRKSVDALGTFAMYAKDISPDNGPIETRIIQHMLKRVVFLQWAKSEYIPTITDNPADIKEAGELISKRIEEAKNPDTVDPHFMIMTEDCLVDDWDTGIAYATQGRHFPIVYEGGQGMLLNEDSKYFPHVTPGTTNPHDIVAGYDSTAITDGTIRVIAVMRPYATKHGAGPFPTEYTGGDLARIKPVYDNFDDMATSDEYMNSEANIAGAFRYGKFNYDDMKESLDTLWASVTPTTIQCIAITHLDCLDQIEDYSDLIRLVREQDPAVEYLGIRSPFASSKSMREYSKDEMIAILERGKPL